MTRERTFSEFYGPTRAKHSRILALSADHVFQEKVHKVLLMHTLGLQTRASHAANIFPARLPDSSNGILRRKYCARTRVDRQATYDVLVRAMRGRLSDVEIDRSTNEGRGMSLDQAIDEVTRVTKAPAS